MSAIINTNVNTTNNPTFSADRQPSLMELGDPNVDQVQFYKNFKKQAPAKQVFNVAAAEQMNFVQSGHIDVNHIKGNQQMMHQPVKISIKINTQKNFAEEQNELEQTMIDCSPSSVNEESENESGMRFCTDFTPEWNLYRGQYEKGRDDVQVGKKRKFVDSSIDGQHAISDSKIKRAKQTRQSLDDLFIDSDYSEEESDLEIPDLNQFQLRRTNAAVFMNIRNKCLYL